MTILSEIWAIWTSGGWIMIPLFLLAFLLYAQAFQLVLYIRRASLRPEGEPHWFEWVRFPEKAEGRVREIIEYTQDGVRTSDQVRNRFEEVRGALISLIDRRTFFVSTLVAAAPRTACGQGLPIGAAGAGRRPMEPGARSSAYRRGA